MSDFFVDFDTEVDDTSHQNRESIQKCSIALEDALNILKLLKAVNVKGL